MNQHLLARIGTERFALALQGVVEALDAPVLHDMPRRPDGMLGTMRHRGHTLPVWDGARAFHASRTASAGTALVLSDAGRQVALIVDDAEDIVTIADDRVHAAPSGTDSEGLLRGVVRDAHGIVSVVRLDALVSRLVSWGRGGTE